jgi:acyl-[acyl-carrier-protein] desaturase
MAVMETGYDRGGRDAVRGMAYVAFQELATRVSHRNTGRYSQDPVADRIMTRISTDENLHMVFYRDMLSAALAVEPSRVVEAVADEVMGFEMPGAGMPEFARKSVQIAKAGIYDLRIHHDDVVWPLLRHWDLFAVEGLDDRAEDKRRQLAGFLERLDAQASRFEDKRARLLQRESVVAR